MRKILIASHGHLADGVKSSIEILCGNKSNISFINAYVDDHDINEDINAYFKSLKPDDEAVILTDIWGGSVTQKFIPYCRQKNVYLIAGFNLAIVLELIFSEEPLTEKSVHELIDKCRMQMIYAKDVKMKEEKEENFFE